ncbi:permease-like cell division protein FtsX [Nonomuraea aurantiaca]|uniref:permease-like cell division protein FtsX n=1 Tax=Nonomuraea aurantiaca TaxID=2878562 RepID=UPI001CD93D4D|nr:permease-like cell division protein FtsX [Nonomuraea aurantiaca]MCA2229447.1 permease-like cell division protein FtsX [Nonomuraea aurantiaca]
MNSPMEDRLREALAEAGATVDPSTLSPLHASGRPRVRVDFRLLAAAGAVVLAGAVTAAVLISPGDEQRAAVANPPADQKGETELFVFLCAKYPTKSPDCPGGSPTGQQTRAIQQALQAVPGVSQVLYENSAGAYLRFRRDYAGNKTLLGAVAVADLPTSFHVQLRAGADVNALQAKLKSIRGVSGTSEPKTDNLSASEQGNNNADISVFLCAKGSAAASCGAVAAPGSTKDAPKFTESGKAITLAQQSDLAREIAKTPGVQSVRFESQQEAYENFKRAYASNKAILKATKPSDMPKSFRLQLRPDADSGEVIAQLQHLPGVASVINSKCVTERLTLYQRYGISLPESKVCAS